MPTPLRSTRLPSSAMAVLGGAALATGGTAAWLWGPRWQFGRAGEWTINPHQPWPLSWWWLPLAVLALWGGLAALAAYDRFHRAKTRAEQRASTTLCVAALTTLALLWPWALLPQGGGLLMLATTWSDNANEYFSTAYGIEDSRDFTRTYAAQRQQPASRLQAHLATHPPGATLFYFAARRVLEAVPGLAETCTALAERLTGLSAADIAREAGTTRDAAARSAKLELPPPLPPAAVAGALWSALLIALAAASLVPAVYLTAAAGASDEAIATDKAESRGLIGAALVALAPSLNLFAFTLDVLIATGVAWMLALAARRLAGGPPICLGAAGAVLALTSFLSFGALSAGVIVALGCLLGRDLTPDPERAGTGPGVRSVSSDLLWFATGFAAGWLVLLLLFPMPLPAIFQNAMAAHHAATLALRSHWVWAALNVATFALFSGWPAVAAAVHSALGWKDEARPAAKPAVALGRAALLTMLLLTLSGSVRGEVERLWIFLLPPLGALAACAFKDGVERRVWPALLALQAAQTLVMAVALTPLVLPF